MDEWTVVDEYNNRLGAVWDQYKEDLEATEGKKDDAMYALIVWFDEHYDGVHAVAWPKEAGNEVPKLRRANGSETLLRME